MEAEESLPSQTQAYTFVLGLLQQQEGGTLNVAFTGSLDLEINNPTGITGTISFPSYFGTIELTGSQGAQGATFLQGGDPAVEQATLWFFYQEDQLLTDYIYLGGLITIEFLGDGREGGTYTYVLQGVGGPKL